MTDRKGHVPAERSGAVARLFGSLANALLGLGLPAIRQWLRDRVGPAADVAHVTTEGKLVHLDGVRVPIGSRGLLVLERATAVILGLGRAGLPEIRLHAFHGMLGFGDAKHGFRADVSFTASPDPEESAWIWGELSIRNASWTAREGSPFAAPMHGDARLFVSSHEWRIDRGRLDGENARARFSGRGSFEGSALEGEAEGDPPQPLVPRVLSHATLELEHARVGPFADAAGALSGRTLVVPSIVPLDARLDGSLSWEVAEGGRVDLRIVSEELRVTMAGSIAPDGGALRGRVDAEVPLARLVRCAGGPREVLPREEDVARVELAIGGSLGRPEVAGRIVATEIGFRLGRPRFVPPVVLRDLSAELSLKQDRAVVRAVAFARATQVTLDLDASVREPTSARGRLHADAIEAGFLRDVIRTLGGRIEVPDDAFGAVDFTLAPREGRSSVAGSVAIATSASRLVLAVAPEGLRVAGRVTAEDLAATGALGGSVRPADGEIDLALDLDVGGEGVRARGKARSARLSLVIAERPDVPPYVLEDVTASVALDPAAFAYDDLRFTAHGGRFVGRGTIPLVPGTLEDSPRIALRVEEGGAELAAALANLIDRRDGASLRLAVQVEGPRPLDEIWIPRDLRASGELRWFGAKRPGALALSVDVTLTTPRGTDAAVAFRLSNRGALDGTTLRGSIALADLVASGALGARAPVLPEGIVDVDAFARGGGEKAAVAGLAEVERLVVLAGEREPLCLELGSVVARFRLDRRGIAWKDVEARAYGGSIVSTGHHDLAGTTRARVSVVGVAVHELPPIGGRAPGSYVRGHLSTSIVVRRGARGDLRAGGMVTLDDATFPALELLRPSLSRYGLRPPDEDAAAPVTALVVGTDWGIWLADVNLELHGATVRGVVGLSRTRALDGRIEVTLEEEYLRTSKVLTIPRVLTQKLVLPVRIEGELARPVVHADLAASFGRFLEDNRVSQFVTSAVEEAQIFLGRHHLSREPRREPAMPTGEAELEAELRRSIEAHAADWAEIARRESERRVRVG